MCTVDLHKNVFFALSTMTNDFLIKVLRSLQTTANGINLRFFHLTWKTWGGGERVFLNVHRITSSIASALMVEGCKTKTVVSASVVENHSNTHNVFG